MKVRISLAIAIMIALYFLYDFDFTNVLSWFFTGILTISFFIVVSLQEKMKLKRSSLISEETLWGNEIKLLTGDLSRILDGSQYSDENHLYSSDLNLFGSDSLFQLINRSNTELGQRELSYWLKNPCVNDTKQIVEKQNAVKELARKNKWSKKFILASSDNNVSENDIDSFKKWLLSKDKKLTSFQHFYPFISISLFVALPILFLLSHTMYNWLAISLFAALLGNLIYLNSLKHERNQLILALRNNLPLLRNYSSMISLIDTEEFTSSYLVDLKKQINGVESEKAFKKIGFIGRLFELASLRGISNEPISRNMFFVILNEIFLIDYFILKIAQKWKNQNRTTITRMV